MGWTKCKDRQPEESGEYLVALVHEISGTYFMHYMVIQYNARHKGWNISYEDEEVNREHEMFPAAWTAIEEYKEDEQ